MKNLKEKGITLIALVVTIIILLILAGVSLQIALGENGLFTYSRKAGEEQCHSAVKEALEMSATTYEMDKLANNGDKSLIEYLQEKGIVEDIGEEGNYKINVEKLVGSKMQLGNGSNRKDVYMLEEKKGIAELGKYATIGEIKIAEGSSGIKEYKIMYYGKTEGKIRNLGTLKDGTDGTEEDTSKIKIEDMYYLTGSYNDETGKVKDIYLSLLPEVQIEILKIVLDKKLPYMTDEEILAKTEGYETFEEMIEELYNYGEIDKKYTSAKELFYASKESEDDNQYEFLILETKAELFGYENMKKISIKNQNGGTSTRNIPIDGIGNYEFTVNFEDEEILRFTVTIDQYEVIDWFGKWEGEDIWQALSVYDFKNEKILKIDEASYEYIKYYCEPNIEDNWKSGTVSDEKIITKDGKSYIKDITKENNYVYRYKILSNGKYIIGYIRCLNSFSGSWWDI